MHSSWHPSVNVASLLVAVVLCSGWPRCTSASVGRFRGASTLGLRDVNTTDSTGPKRHLVVAHYDEDISWLQNLPKEWDVVVYQSKDPNGEHFVENVGNEASKYLSYIVDHYDELPDSVGFVQAGRQDWHDPMPKDESLPHWHWGNAAAHGGIVYLPSAAPCIIEDSVKLSADQTANPRIEVDDERECPMLHEHMPMQMDTVKQAWDLVFSSELGPLPQRWLAHCCAQFEVTREAIQNHPRDFYVNLLNWVEQHDKELLASDYSGDMRRNHDPQRRDAGHVMEVLWVLLFTNPESRIILPEMQVDDSAI